MWTKLPTDRPIKCALCSWKTEKKRLLIILSLVELYLAFYEPSSKILILPTWRNKNLSKLLLYIKSFCLLLSLSHIIHYWVVWYCTWMDCVCCITSVSVGYIYIFCVTLAFSFVQPEYRVDITPTPPLCVYWFRPHKMLYLVNWTQMDTTSNIMSFCGAWLIRWSSTSTYKTNSLALNIMEIMSNQPNGL